ncbi:rhodanese-like domain-containing protein [Nocardiopsis kunsanensis]|uniref:Sulfurtransferase n=1 Tax=Nocardiopsis kunsanensis TaxID=141693 RepID=A0A918XDU7_9ACTN|nr:rhodanese-like domain-containing protein [Nocardiopsis kunsanensis]GHD27315.1 sulfurtransferase [Nocardiopsis kunsanensis]
MSRSSIDVPSVRALLERAPDTLVVDVRTPAEYESSHIDGSVNLPLGRSEPYLERLAADARGPLILVCQAGPRAEQFHDRLAEAGAADATVMTGGMNTWEAVGAPVVRGRERWALERQVRLVAGSIVLVSALTSLAWQPAVWVAAFIGAGLTFAAVTNTCGMAMALSKLPYNQPHNAVDMEASMAHLTGAAEGPSGR